MRPDELLPQSVSGWKAAGEDKVFTRDTIFEYMDGAGEIYLAYDFERLAVREYTKPSAPRIVVEVYQMASSEDAYGVFSHDTDGRRVTVGQDAIYAAGLLRFWKDRLFFRLLAEEETPEAKAAVLALGKRIAGAIPRAGKKPRLLACLPTRGLEEQSVRYFHTQVSLNVHYYLADSNLLNLRAKTNLVLARYQRGERKVRLLLCRYPEPKLARTAFEQFSKVYLKSPAKKDFETAEAEKGEFVSARWMQGFVILVFEGADRETCEALTQSVLARIKEVFP